jgi:hypothetical protein
LEIVKSLLEKSGYTVVPYGYEKTLTSVKRDLSKSDSSVTANKIRSSPDLLVYNWETRIAKFVEVKMSKYESPRLNRLQLEQYRAYWDDAILVMVIPFGNRFYSQRIHDLGLKQDNEQYDPNSDFKKIQTMFEKIDQKDIEYYGDIAHSLIKAWHMKPCDFEQDY